MRTKQSNKLKAKHFILISIKNKINDSRAPSNTQQSSTLITLAVQQQKAKLTC